MSAHPRRERRGATLTQHGVTAPGDDLGYVDPEGNHQVGDQDSFPPEAGYRASFTIPSWNGQSRPVTEHRPPAWGQHGVLYKNRTLMTAFTFRSCWVLHLPHGAHGSVFHIGLSKLKAWPVLPSGEDNRGVAPGLHDEGPCETTAASRPLPEGMIGCPRRNAGFRVRRSLRPR